MELSKEYSEQQALIINCIKSYLPLLDDAYLKEAVKAFFDKAHFTDSAAVLNRRYNPKQAELLRTQGTALNRLLEFKEYLIKCEELKQELEKSEHLRQEIEELFV